MDTVASDETQDKAWTRSDVLRYLQTLFKTAESESVKLKCLELVLENLPPEPPPESKVGAAMLEARKRAHAVVGG